MGGWSERKYYYMSWALSTLRLLQYYDEVELYTDSMGHEILCERLQLPFSKVHVKLNKLRRFDPSLWTMGKLFVYQSQRSAFLHVDSDIFIWKRFPTPITEAPLVAQNIEDQQHYYRPVVRELIASFVLPSWLRRHVEKRERVLVSNTGIIGGTDVKFINRYATRAIDFVRKNMRNLHKVNAGAYGVTVEQLFLFVLASDNHIPIRYLINEHIDYSRNGSLFRIHHVPARADFIHPLAGFKKVPEIYRAVEQNLRIEFPQIYYKIVGLFNQRRA